MMLFDIHSLIKPKWLIKLKRSFVLCSCPATKEEDKKYSSVLQKTVVESDLHPDAPDSQVRKCCLPFLTLCAVETTQCCEARLPQRSAMAAHEARKVPKQITRSLAILTRTMREEHSNVEEVGRLKVAQCSLLLFSST